MSPFLIRALQLIFSLSILIVIHEFGHFLFARLSGTRVERFYLFFNPGFSLFRCKRINGKMEFSFLSKNPPSHWENYPETTTFGIGWLPLGGYCSIAGMIDETQSSADLAAIPQPWEFRTKSPVQRLMIMAGGVLFNFILALLLYSMVLGLWGTSYLPLRNVPLGMEFSEPAHRAGFCDGDIILSADGQEIEQFNDLSFRAIVEADQVLVLRQGVVDTVRIPGDFMQQLMAAGQGFAAFRYPTVVKQVLPGRPGALAGLLPGDSLVAIQGKPTPAFSDFVSVLGNYADSTVCLDYYRDGQLARMSIRLDSTALIGFSAMPPTELYETRHVSYSFWQSIPAGIRLAVRKLGGYASDMKYVFTKEGARSLGGFGAIGSLFPPAWNWRVFWETTAFLSVILAFMNILPIPGLDGGHILFLLVEVITRRKPSDKFIERAQTVGMILLLFLLIYANGNDIFRWLFK
ncbi:MAG: site-2 protease family protein [Bacteroidales bacterium]|nr:site-2 protease family protein [Bacteroidales bacterium]